MPRGDQLARQWQIIQTIAASQTGKTTADLADELSANPRSVYRDLEALQTAGFPIYTNRVNGKNLWALLDAVKHQIPVPFAFTELMALYFSRDMLKALQDTVFHDSLESLFRKIKATLPPEALTYLKSVQQTFSVGRKGYKHYSQYKEIINRVTEAALAQKTLSIVYHGMNQKKETRRKVNPYRIWFFNGTFYLVGYCHLRSEVRIFALDRIRTLTVTNEYFTVPEDFDFEDMMRGSFGVITGTPEQVRIVFGKKVAGYIAERVWHSSQKLSPRDDGTLLFEANIAVNEELKTWILSWGSDSEVLHPPRLIDAMRAEIQKLSGIYRTGTGRGRKQSRQIRRESNAV